MNFLLNLTIWISSVILRGFVLQVLWKWFVVPLGAVPIGIPHALGISIIITYLTFKKPQEDVKWEEAMAASIGISCFALLFGYIFKLFM